MGTLSSPAMSRDRAAIVTDRGVAGGLNVLVAETDGTLQIASRLRNFCLLTSRAECRMYGRFDRASAGLPIFQPSNFISVWSQFTHDRLTVHRGKAENS